MNFMKLLNYHTHLNVLYYINRATNRFCEQEKNRYNNNIDVQAILPEKCYKQIYSEEDQEDRYKLCVTSPIRILYTFGNVEEVKEYSVTPLCENEEFIAAAEKKNRDYVKYDHDNIDEIIKRVEEEKRLTNQAFRIIFGEEPEITPEDQELTMAINLLRNAH